MVIDNSQIKQAKHLYLLKNIHIFYNHWFVYKLKFWICLWRKHSYYFIKHLHLFLTFFLFIFNSSRNIERYTSNSKTVRGMITWIKTFVIAILSSLFSHNEGGKPLTHTKGLAEGSLIEIIQTIWPSIGDIWISTYVRNSNKYQFLDSSYFQI